MCCLSHGWPLFIGLTVVKFVNQPIVLWKNTFLLPCLFVLIGFMSQKNVKVIWRSFLLSMREESLMCPVVHYFWHERALELNHRRIVNFHMKESTQSFFIENMLLRSLISLFLLDFGDWLFERSFNIIIIWIFIYWFVYHCVHCDHSFSIEGSMCVLHVV